MTQLDEAISLITYLIDLGTDLDTAAAIAERRFQTPAQTLIKLFTESSPCN
jgi:hypothetical protein